ncbi:hypothetical protein [Polyangium spumosum]|uniref:Arrestin-like N-terminal domain-containing protein n=1 Tax=Polyangium spumosum TaxID=889282 RepID=A0A6N7Q022_9BACT|nr:hypothetical protein [Polyangium spumosum]MRG96486.1 hypothetical protein [Polyangium spumosum]
MSRRLSIHLDRQDAVHRPGELITGRVELVCPESRRCDELVASLDWEVESRGEPFSSRGAPVLLAAGLALSPGAPTLVPFEIPAPSGPLTYHGHILTVSWTLRVEAKLGWASRERVEARILLLPWTEEARALTATGYRKAPSKYALVYDPGPLPEATLEKRDESRTVEHPLVGVSLAAASVALLVLRAGAFTRILALLLLVGGLSALFAHLRRRTLRERLGPPELAVLPEIVRAGEVLTVSVSFEPGRPEVLKDLVISVSAQEVVLRPSSEPDEPRHYRHSLHGERRLVDRGRLRLPPGRVTVIQEMFRIPLRGPPSFGAPNNEVRWEVTATARTADLVSWKQTQRILVHPPSP